MAYAYTLLNHFRLNNGRLGYTSGSGYVGINNSATGPGKPMRVTVASLSIADRLNETPNTCTCQVLGTKPIEGQTLTVRLGSQNGTLLFAGTILRTTQIYLAENPQNLAWNVEATDYTWGLNARLVTARYQNQSATAIGQALVAAYAPIGYSSAGIAAGLPTVAE